MFSIIFILRECFTILNTSALLNLTVITLQIWHVTLSSHAEGERIQGTIKKNLTLTQTLFRTLILRCLALYGVPIFIHNIRKRTSASSLNQMFEIRIIVMNVVLFVLKRPHFLCFPRLLEERQCPGIFINMQLNTINWHSSLNMILSTHARQLHKNHALGAVDWLIDWLMFSVPLWFFLWKRHHCRWRDAKLI